MDKPLPGDFTQWGIARSEELIKQVEPPTRYFAVIIKGNDELGGVLTASSNLGEILHGLLHCSYRLPMGWKMIRCIEISRELATKTW